jgi:hypothetical protein
MNREEIAKIENKILLHHNSANPKKAMEEELVFAYLHTHTRTHQDREHGTSNQ